MRNRDGIIERMVKGTRKWGPVALLLGGVGSTTLPGCGPGYVPKDVAEKWGWQYEERDVDYRESLRHRTVVGERIDPQNEWLVLNHMMYHLLNKKAKGRYGSQAQKFLAQLDSKQDPLHFMDDSAKVADIYERAFISENIDIERETPNDFMYVHLAKRILPDVLKYGGFELVKGLNEWGKVLVEKGPFKNFKRGFNSIEAVSESSGLTYRATEHKRTMELMIDYVGVGPSDKFKAPEDPLAKADESGNPRSGESIEHIESRLLRMAEERNLYLPTDHKSFDPAKIRKVSLVKLPCPNVDSLWLNDPRQSARDSFYSREWDGNRLVIDVSADVGEFVDKNGIAEFDIRYFVKQPGTFGKMLIEDTVHVRDSVGHEGGLTKRLITKPFPHSDSCDVHVVLDNGDKKLSHPGLVTSAPGTYPLEIFEYGGRISSSGVPFFHIGDVEKGKKYIAYFPLDGDTDSGFTGHANFLVLPKRSSIGGGVKIGELTILGKDHKPGEEFYYTLDQVLRSYGGKCFQTKEFSSRQPKGYFLLDFEFPKGFRPGEYTLAAEFYKDVDKNAKTVEKIGEAYKEIRIK